jgi:hypothetical protein
MGGTFAQVRQANASTERPLMPSRFATTHSGATSGLAWLTILAADEQTVCQRKTRHPVVRSQQQPAFGVSKLGSFAAD